MIVLDTDHLSLLTWEDGAAGQGLETRLLEAGEAGHATTIITYEEQVRGWLAYLAKARSASQITEGFGRLNRHLDAFRSIRVFGFDHAEALIFLELKGSRLRVGSMDLKIAAIAISCDATLLSRNLGDFRKVPGLKVEDWSG